MDFENEELLSLEMLKFNEMSISTIRCGAHMFKLAIKNFLIEFKEICDIVKGLSNVLTRDG